jgi:CubicO group peptidase (beta-lactamase class C family)
MALAAAAMAFPGARWNEAHPEYLGMDADKLKCAIDYLTHEFMGAGGASEVVIVRRGYVVARGIDSDRKHNVWSVGKTFTSTVLGLLIDDGKCTLETLCSEHEPLLKDSYPGVKLVHFATMTSGYDAVGFSAKHAHEDGRGDWGPDPYRPDTPLFPPATKFCYHDEAMFMLGRVLTRIAAETMRSILKRRITDQIGMGDWGWPTKGQVEGMDLDQGCGGVVVSAEQLARWGHLFLNHGSWMGRQLVSRAWVEQATRNQVPTALGVILDKSRQIDGRGRYGYNWWVNGVRPDGSRKYPDAPSSMYWASGYNNNVCFVISDWSMVIVRTGMSGSPNNVEEIWNAFFKKLRAALIEE